MRNINKNSENNVNNIKKANKKARKAAVNNKKPYIYNGVTYYSVREVCKVIGIEEKAGTIRNIIREKKIDIQEAIDAYLERHPELVTDKATVKETKATKATEENKVNKYAKIPCVYNSTSCTDVQMACNIAGIGDKSNTIRGIIRRKGINVQEAIDAYLERHPELVTNKATVKETKVTKATEENKANKYAKIPCVYNGTSCTDVQMACNIAGIGDKSNTIRGIIRQKGISVQEAIDAYLERHPELLTRNISKTPETPETVTTPEVPEAAIAETPVDDKTDKESKTVTVTAPDQLVESEIQKHPYYGKPIACEYKGVKHRSLSSLARSEGITTKRGLQTFLRRYRNGMSIEEALNTPVRQYNPYNPEKDREKLAEYIAKALKKGGEVCYDEEGRAYPSEKVCCIEKGVTIGVVRWRQKHGHWKTGIYSPAKMGRKTQKHIPFKGKKEISIAFNGAVFETDVAMCAAYPVKDDQLYKKRIAANWSKRDAMLTPQSADMDEDKKPKPAPMAVGFELNDETGFGIVYVGGCYVISKQQAEKEKAEYNMCLQMLCQGNKQTKKANKETAKARKKTAKARKKAAIKAIKGGAKKKETKKPLPLKTKKKAG